MVSCKPVTTTLRRKHKKVRITKQVCSTKLVSGTVKFTTTTTGQHASLSRKGVVYATGYARHTAGGLRIWLLAPQRLARGRYTLVLGSSQERRRTADHQTITIR